MLLQKFAAAFVNIFLTFLLLRNDKFIQNPDPAA
jgi:hypothetical protein